MPKTRSPRAARPAKAVVVLPDDAHTVPMSSDSFGRHIFQHRRLADLFVRRYLRTAGLRLSPAPIVPVGGKFVSGGLRVCEADAVFMATLANGEKVYVLIEFKSRNDARTPWQLLRYMVQLWEHQLREHPRERRAIIPIVLYSGAPRWTAPTAGARIVVQRGRLDALRSRLAALGCRLDYLLCDLARLDLEALLGEPGLRASLRALALPRYDRRAYIGILQAFPEGHPLGRGCVEFLGTIRGATHEGVESLLRHVRPLRWRKTMAAAIHGVYAEGLENGQRVMLLEMLESFFGPLSAKARRCIAEASPKQVKSWALAVRDANSVDDVLNGKAR